MANTSILVGTFKIEFMIILLSMRGQSSPFFAFILSEFMLTNPCLQKLHRLTNLRLRTISTRHIINNTQCFGEGDGILNLQGVVVTENL